MHANSYCIYQHHNSQHTSYLEWLKGSTVKTTYMHIYLCMCYLVQHEEGGVDDTIGQFTASILQQRTKNNTTPEDEM